MTKSGSQIKQHSLFFITFKFNTQKIVFVYGPKNYLRSHFLQEADGYQESSEISENLSSMHIKPIFICIGVANPSGVIWIVTENITSHVHQQIVTVINKEFQRKY